MTIVIINLVVVFILQRGKIYRAMVNESANEYSFFRQTLKTLVGVNEKFDNGTVCPACPTVCDY